jgi:RND family efflux transporter MFP subunit
MTDERHANRGLPTSELHGPEHDLEKRQRTLGIARKALIVIGIILFLGLLRILVLYLLNSNNLDERSKLNNVMNVSVAKATGGPTDSFLTLPSTIASKNETLVYARTPGYVKEWLKDIGATVKQGDVLAVLETPELNKQAEEAEALFRLTQVAYKRWTDLRKEDAVSEQELDEKTSAYKVAQANFQRVKELQKFGKIIAPFDGIVTRRNVNVGDLVNSGNSGTAQALFGVSQTKNLHIYVYVSQKQANAVSLGQEVKVVRPEAPDKKVLGKIVRTAGAIDVATRTMQVEIDIPNDQPLFLPGSYVEASIPLNTQGRLILPTNTLMFGSAGPQVAVVQDGRVLRKSVALGVDYGRTVEIISGIDSQDQVIVNPSNSVVDGQAVAIIVPPKESAATSSAPSSAPAPATTKPVETKKPAAVETK